MLQRLPCVRVTRACKLMGAPCPLQRLQALHCAHECFMAASHSHKDLHKSRSTQPARLPKSRPYHAQIAGTDQCCAWYLDSTVTVHARQL